MNSEPPERPERTDNSRGTDLPVVLIIYNRSEALAHVVEAVARAKPGKVYVVADGPRPGDETDALAVQGARRVVSDEPWECETHWIASDVNLGCKTRVTSGLDEVFRHEEAAIILEDDCIPHPSFFSFCADMLEGFAGDRRVASVCGSNLMFGFGGDERAYFSRYPMVWGWATWRDRWLDARVSSVDINSLKGELPALPGRVHQHIETKLASIAAGRLDSWGYVWLGANLALGRLHLVASANMVSNVGFGDNATHTTRRSYAAGIDAAPDDSSIQAPTSVEADRVRDTWLESLIFNDVVALKAASRLVANSMKGYRRLVRRVVPKGVHS